MAIHPIIEASRAEIAALCRQFHVLALDLFGSAARGGFDAERSDFDFLVAFDLDASADAFNDYFGLKESLEALLGRPVDLISDGTVRNPYLRKSIERDRVRLFPA